MKIIIIIFTVADWDKKVLIKKGYPDNYQILFINKKRIDNNFSSKIRLLSEKFQRSLQFQYMGCPKYRLNITLCCRSKQISTYDKRVKSNTK